MHSITHKSHKYIVITIHTSHHTTSLFTSSAYIAHVLLPSLGWLEWPSLSLGVSSF
jgi:hypothetical protein